MSSETFFTKEDSKLSFAVVAHPRLLKALGFDSERVRLSEERLDQLLYLPMISVLLCGAAGLVQLRKTGVDFESLPLTNVESGESRLELSYLSLMNLSRSRTPLKRPVSICIIDSGVSSYPGITPELSVSFVEGYPYCDEVGHGTTVAFAIADPSPESTHCGLAVGARIYSAKVLDHQGSVLRESALIRAINWAVFVGAEVVNLSIGFDRNFDAPKRACTVILENFLASRSRPIFVAAAGHGFTGVSDPAVAKGVIAIGGSNGPRLDANSPQGDANIIFACAQSAGFNCHGYKGSMGCLHELSRIRFDGTSAACAFVSALVARAISSSDDATFNHVRDRLRQLAIVPDGWDFSIGGIGIIDPRQLDLDSLSKNA